MKRLTKRLEDEQAVMDCTGCPESWNTNPVGKCTALYCRNMLKDRLAAYEDTGLEPEEIEKIHQDVEDGFLKSTARRYGVPVDRLREFAQADRMIGEEVWAQAKYLNLFQTKPSIIQRTTVQYISLLKGGDILCHTQTCAFPLNEIGKTVFLTREDAEAALRRE